MKRKLISLTIAISFLIYGLTLVPITKAQANFVIDYFTLQSDRDCDVYELQPDTNQICDTRTVVAVQSRNETRDLRIFVHFLSLSILLGDLTNNKIINASMSVYITSTPGTTRIYDVSRVDGAWTETDLTWNNQPSANSDSNLISVTSGPADYWLSINVSNIVRSWVENETSNNGIRIKDTVEDSASATNNMIFYSREGANKPMLHINTTGLGNIFVSGLITFVYVSLLLIMVIGGFFIAMVIRGKRK